MTKANYVRLLKLQVRSLAMSQTWLLLLTIKHPEAERVNWAEAVQVSLDFKNGNLWLLLNPDIWIWPLRARKISAAFIENRRKNRFNKKFNDLLDAWVRIILGTDERNTEVMVSAFAQGSEAENPSFCLATRTAFSKRLMS